MKKRLLTVLLAVMLVVSLGTVSAWAEDTSGTSGGIEWKVEDNVLRISAAVTPESGYESGVMKDLSTNNNDANKQPWLSFKDSITKIVVDEGVKAIGGTAFRGISTCTVIQLPSTLTSIGASAFTSMNALTTIEVADGNRNFAIYNGVLYTYGYETLIKYPDAKADTTYTVHPNCVEIGSDACFKALPSTMLLPNGLRTIGSWSLSSMQNLKSITIPNTVTLIGSSAFNGTPLETLIFEENSHVETIASGAFYKTSLTGELVIPASVKTIGEDSSTYGAFSTIENLTSISFAPGSNCTFIGNKTFSANGVDTKLQSVTIPSSVVYIGQQAFMGNDDLENVIIEGNEQGLTIDSNAFANIGTSVNITIGNEDTTTLLTVKGSAFKNEDEKASLYGDGSITVFSNLTEIGQSAFTNTNLTGTVVIGTGSTTEEVAVGRYAFQNTKVDTVICNSDVTTFNTQAFEEASSLKKLIIKASEITVYQSWANTDSLQVVDMTSVDKIGENSDQSSSNVWFSDSNDSKTIVYLNNPDLIPNYGNYDRAVKVDVNNGIIDILADSVGNEELATPIREGYYFGGWYDNSEFSGEKVENPTVGNTYYAKWTESDYKVPESIDLGSMASGSEKSGTITVTLPNGNATITSAVSSDPYVFSAVWSGNTITITPRANLRAGNYSGVLTVTTGDNATFTVNVTFTIEPAPVVNIPDTYDIDLIVSDGGEAKTNLSNASAGTTITVTATPDEGYELDYITVDGERIYGTSFKMPDHDVTVRVYFTDGTSALPFTDVSANQWFYDAVSYVYANGMMEGDSATTFNPDGNMTRAMVWAILARIDGETVTGANWVDTARTWAMSEGVSDGTDPNGLVTREQLATMLWRYAGEPESDYSLSAYTDAASVSDYAATAMAWAVENGVISGVTATTLEPQGTATRAQCAAILMRSAEDI